MKFFFNLRKYNLSFQKESEIVLLHAMWHSGAARDRLYNIFHEITTCFLFRQLVLNLSAHRNHLGILENTDV